jgi:glycosyltransferase involved in cell wall biosynthesis
MPFRTPEHMWGDMLRTSRAPGTDLADRTVAPPIRTASQRHRPRLKICFISETVHAGVGRHLVDAVSELSRRGHEIHLLYSPTRCEPQFLAALTEQPNVTCTPVVMPREIGLKDQPAFAAIRTYVRRHGPFDVVHGHSSKGGGYARLLKLFGGGTVVYTPHAFVTLSPVTGPVRRVLYRLLERALARLTDRIICASRGEHEHARSLGIAADRLKLIPNGSAKPNAPSRSAVRAELGLAADQIVVGFAGRMEDQKAPQYLIAAMRRLLPDFPKLTLLMIGDGAMRPLLEAQLELAGLGGRAVWLGSVDAQAYMPAMDIFVLPSLYEGFAYVLIEALYAGLPIVSTPVGGSHESITPGVNGLIVPHGSPDGMAVAIRTLAADSGLRRRMAEASRAHAGYFSIPRMVDSIEDLYFRLVASRPFARPELPTGVSRAEPA